MIDFEDQNLDDEEDAEDLDADLTQHAMVSCPHCGEAVEVPVDQGVGGVQEYVEDCQVCCRPWAVRVTVDFEGRPWMTVTTLDDG